MLIEWRPEARAALREILNFIGERNMSAAESLYASIEQAVSALPSHPYLYRLGRVPGTREIVVHPNYLVIYRVRLTCIEIIQVMHARREYPQASPASTTESSKRNR